MNLTVYCPLGLFYSSALAWRLKRRRLGRKIRCIKMLNSKQPKGVEGVIEANRPKLKKVFTRLMPDKDGRVSFSELVKFCKLTKIFPV
jgi:hypothetical protein